MQQAEARLGFAISYQPLSVSSCLDADFGIPTTQTFDAATGEWTPDYEITPLVIEPKVQTIDPDEYASMDDARSLLANIRWYELADGTQRELPTGEMTSLSEPTASITPEGDPQAGRIVYRHNTRASNPVTLIFEADLVDTRLGQIHKLHETLTIHCTDITKAVRFDLAVRKQGYYNPLTDPDLQAVQASYYVGNEKAEAPNVLFKWYVAESIAPDGTISWREYGTDLLDYEMEISEDTSRALIDRRLMGSKIMVKCGVYYDENGDPASQPMADSKEFCIRRRLPPIYAQIAVGQRMPKDLTTIRPQLLVSGNKRSYIETEADKQKFNETFEVKWKAVQLAATGTMPDSAYTEVATGLQPDIDISGYMGGARGRGQLKAEVVDRGWLRTITVGGKYLTVNGKMLLAKSNS